MNFMYEYYQTEEFLQYFDPLFDPKERVGTCYFELYPDELTGQKKCWIPGSFILADVAFDFFVGSFNFASDAFNYYSFQRFGDTEITRLLSDLRNFVDSVAAEPIVLNIFSRHVYSKDRDLSRESLEPLAQAVCECGETMINFIESKTKDTKCLWVLGM